MYKKNTVVIDYRGEDHTFHFRMFGSHSILVMLYQHGDPDNAVKLGYIDSNGQWADACHHMYWLTEKEIVKTYIAYKAGRLFAGDPNLNNFKYKEYNMKVFNDYIKNIFGGK